METNNDYNRSAEPEVIEVESDDGIENCSPKQSCDANEKTIYIDESLVDDDDIKCIICLDSWTHTGSHRICSLRCGHTFGTSCIVRWLDTNRNCPTCKSKASKSDIRSLYVRTLLPDDFEELEKLERKKREILDELKCLEDKFEELTNKEEVLQRQHQEYLQTIEDLQVEIAKNISSGQCNQNSTKEFLIYKHQTHEVNKEGGSRVMDYQKNTDLLVVSMKTSTKLFGNCFGLKKIDIKTNSGLGFVTNHQKPVRDIKFHKENDILLSVSQDNTAKLIQMDANASVGTINCQGPLFSCCWDHTNFNIFYLGRQGAILTYDLRNLNEIVRTTLVESDPSPVIALNSIGPNQTLPRGCLISCSLNSVWALNYSSHDDHMCPLPLEGPFLSAMYHASNQHFLISSRPNSKVGYSRHTLCCLSKVPNVNEIHCDIVHCLQGSFTQTHLSRSCMFTFGEMDYVAAHNEAFSGTAIWNASTSDRVHLLHTQENILDICHLRNSNSDFLACLSDKKIQLYKLDKNDA